ncbi:unnamed protein product [Diabrotica balteata]|uniref:Protein FAM98A n=1 Tax=Diabrotica balteata TaxID=107213 RepID=A0A9N9XFN7_DIABA|nr:unnamed protein product [Diabrotica balteata]
MDIVGKGIFNGYLSDKQWEVLNGVQEDLHSEYKIRREMLLTRLDVTIQSFQWSDRTKGKDDVFEKLYHDRRKLLKVEPDVDLADLLAARTDIAIIEKTSSSSVRRNTRSSLNRIIIGQVPDRGGRTSEIAPPPPEMPSWQQRSAGPGGRGGGNMNRGGGNFNRGGGNFNRGGGNNFSRGGGGNNYSRSDSFSGGGGGNYQSEGGNYQSNRGGFQSGGGRGRYDDNKAFDSAGSYNSSRGGGGGGGRSYDSFQANKTTYADQYVQERQHNQQYYSKDDRGYGNDRGPRDDRRESRGGRSNYHRGGRGSYR